MIFLLIFLSSFRFYLVITECQNGIKIKLLFGWIILTTQINLFTNANCWLLLIQPYQVRWAPKSCSKKNITIFFAVVTVASVAIRTPSEKASSKIFIFGCYGRGFSESITSWKATWTIIIPTYKFISHLKIHWLNAISSTSPSLSNTPYNRAGTYQRNNDGKPSIQLIWS